jgi:hypothetical protein
MRIISIGRDEDCNIVYPDIIISRHHAILKIHFTGKMEIVDMGQNGTYVNGNKLTPNVPYPVSRKDVVSFAHIRRLEWSQVPNYSKYYYMALIGIIAIVGIFIIAKICQNSSLLPKKPLIETTKTVPPLKENKPESQKKDSTYNAPKGKDSAVSPIVFQKKKEKPKGEAKKDSVDKKKPENKKEAMPIL